MSALLFPHGLPDRQAVGQTGLLLLIAVVLLLLDEYGIQRAFYKHFASLPVYQPLQGSQQALAAQFHFTLSCLVLLVAVPLMYGRLFPVQGMDHHGLSVRGVIRHFPAYLAPAALILPVVWIASASPAFMKFYPMYKPVAISDWLLYELIYLLQFFAVEFFFRGFCLFRLERFTGSYAIAIMVIPYALLHIYKPLPEALGSVIAGMVLGYLALRTRSIWPGLFLHGIVALSMDTFSLFRNGWFES